VLIAALSAVIMALLAVAAYLVHTRLPRTEESNQLGQVRIYPAWLRAKGFVYLFSGARGWTTADEESARELARSDRLVVGLDTPQFLKWINEHADGCLYLPGLLEDYSRAWQRQAGNAQYLAPAVLGHDLGATLAYMTQIQAPPTAFDAVVAIDPEPSIWLHRPLCDHAAAATDLRGQTVRAEPPGRNVLLRMALDHVATSSQRQFAANFPGLTTTTDLPLHRIYRRELQQIEDENQRSGVADLPLAEVPAQTQCRDAFAVLYSGDGGWRDLDRRLADILASKGMSVVGVDVLRYYWKEKSPEVAARDLARIMRYYETRWHCSKVVVIGFSFGADVLPFIVSRLPAELRPQVSLISMLSPERTTAFEVQVNGWLGGKPKAGIPIAPEMKRLSAIPIQCFYGEDEAADSLCTDSAAGTLHVVAKSGGHHFDQNYVEVADQILAAIPH
jgi:type IV secretory pathway VirJ component